MMIIEILDGRSPRDMGSESTYTDVPYFTV